MRYETVLVRQCDRCFLLSFHPPLLSSFLLPLVLHFDFPYPQLPSFLLPPSFFLHRAGQRIPFSELHHRVGSSVEVRSPKRHFRNRHSGGSQSRTRVSLLVLLTCCIPLYLMSPPPFILLSFIVLYWIGLDWIVLDWIGLYWIGLDWIVLYCIVLYCIVLYCIGLFQCLSFCVCLCGCFCVPMQSFRMQNCLSECPTAYACVFLPASVRVFLSFHHSLLVISQS